MNKTEEQNMLKELHKESVSIILFGALFFGLIVCAAWGSAIMNMTAEDTNHVKLTIETIISAFITGLYIYALIGFTRDSIKIKKCIKHDTYKHEYIPIVTYEATANTLYAKYWYAGENRSVASSTHKAKMVHVFDCNGTVVAKVEETKDLLK